MKKSYEFLGSLVKSVQGAPPKTSKSFKAIKNLGYPAYPSLFLFFQLFD